jgi:hypothetical protein
MQFFKKKLNQADLEELKRREELINSHKLVVSALEMQKTFYLNKILPKYGCDLNKNYQIDFKTGKIVEAKRNPNELERPPR